jgi:glycosyltransferase involved in cell wall biosynthesis
MLIHCRYIFKKCFASALNFATMVIAINTRILSGNIASLEFLEVCFELLAAEYAEHSFIFIASKKSKQNIKASQNVQTIVLEQQSTSPLLCKLWYQYKLPALLKKIKADVLINADGACSLRTNIPQYLLVNDLDYLQHPEWYPKKFTRFIQSNTPAFLQKAKRIITHTLSFKNEIIGKYQINPKKIEVIYPGTNPLYQPFGDDEKLLIKENYSSGKEYFLFHDQINQQTNLVLLLKAFSFFKKRQKSNMQLIIIARDVADDNTIIASLSTYKYRNEVVVLKSEDVPAIQAITAAAYAFISVPYQQNDFTRLLNVLQCSVPVVVSNTEKNKEMLAGAALYANAGSFEDIADKMMLLFKDEDKRNDIIEKGILLVNNYNWNTSAKRLWETIIDTIE